MDWRVAVLKAMITTVDGDISAGKSAFAALEGVAPEDALHDAKATSVVVLSSLGKDGSSLLSDLRGTSGAYAAYRSDEKNSFQIWLIAKLPRTIFKWGIVR